MQNKMLEYAPPQRHLRSGWHVAVRTFACLMAAGSLVAVGTIITSMVRADDWGKFFLGAAHYALGVLLSIFVAIAAAIHLARHRDAAIWVILGLSGNLLLAAVATWYAYQWLILP